ncbi:MAG: SCO2522 family protein [Umezawaea sp.]
MTGLDAPVYTESATRREPRQVPLSHVSVEVGHLYMQDFIKGDDRIRAQFRKVKPWLDATRAALKDDVKGVAPRLSTCFLIDDYFRPNDTKPAEVIGRLVRIAKEFDFVIDYLAREAGCFEADGIPLAEITAAMLLPEPPVGTTGSRPPVQESGWLCNGERSPNNGGGVQAMMPVTAWKPAVEFGRRNHSIFLDVELWRDWIEKVEGVDRPQRLWSCPFLASVWQLLRLGVLRYEGEPVAEPRRLSGELPEQWSDLPAVLQLSERAAPFSAYRTMSVLPQAYLGIEHAVRVILSHLDIDESVIVNTIKRAAKDGITVPRELSTRVSHIFVEAPVAGSPW